MADVDDVRRAWGRTRPTGEGHRVTTFELFFDLVYVFAITQVTGHLAHEHSLHGIVQGLLMLALLWWTWAGYTWLGNQARADEGLLRAGMAIAMAAMFVVSLTIPEAWHDMPGGLEGPVVFVGAYFLVRAIHLAVYTVAAAEAHDSGLRHQLAITWVPTLTGTALLLVGALLGGWAQTALFAAALLAEAGGTYLTSRRGSWRLRSAGHWVERHGLFLILAIGESVVAIGVGAAEQPISGPLLLASFLGVAVAVCLWWLYFDLVSLAAEHRLLELDGQARVKLVIDAYSYGHFPIIAGVVLTALGLEGVLAHAAGTEGLGGFYAPALFGGLALYLAGHLLFKRLVHRTVNVPRAVTVLVLLAVLPGAVFLPPLAALAAAIVVLGVLVAVETALHAPVRRALREAG